MSLARAAARLDTLARAQRGAFSRWQALHVCGFDPRTAARRVSTGRWVRMHPGVYVLPSSRDTPLRRLWVVLLAADPTGSRAVVSAVTAAGVWRLADMPIEPPYHLAMRDRCQRDVPRAVVHQHATLRNVDTVTYDGTPVTGVPRTIVDAAGLVRLTTTEDLLVEAFRRRLATCGAMQAVVDHVPTLAGTAAVRRLLRQFDPDQARRLMSRVETTFLVRVVRAHRLPPPVVNRRLFLPGRILVAKVDFRWPPQRASVEVDGLRFHSTPTHKRHDDDRQNALVLSGERVLRYSAGVVLRDAERVTGEVQRLLGV